MNPLLRNPIWDLTDPDDPFVVVYQLPDSFTRPSFGDKVIVKVATIQGRKPFHKASMARHGLYQAIRDGLVTKETILVEASSGNTARGLDDLCNSLGIQLVLIMPGDMPEDKIAAIRALGHAEIRLHYDKKETTVECARRLGSQEGWHNLDQYRGSWNAESHYLYLAPQVFGQAKAALFFAATGTVGTCLGVERYAKERGLGTKVVPVVCAPGEEVPAVRTFARIERDVYTGWRDVFARSDFEEIGGHESFLWSRRLWDVLPIRPGPSGGAGVAGAQRFISRHREEGTLGQFKDREGNTVVIVLAPDNSDLYHQLYIRELSHEELSGRVIM